MLLLRLPDDNLIKATIDAQRHAKLAYANVGWTDRSMCPTGFIANGCKTVIGHGEGAFQRAKNAIQEYRMLNLGWIEHIGPREPIAENSIVCTLARQFGIYSLNAARIVYVNNSSPSQFGFGYGTLPEYPVVGEERFTVTFDETSGDVTYEIFSFSRPASLLVSLGWLLVRRAQKRFCRESTTAMRRACLT